MKPEDIEKAHESPSLNSVSQFELYTDSSNAINAGIDTKPQPRYQRWIECLKNVESRGIERVLPEDREQVTASTTLHMLLMWFSMALATNNIIVGSMGTLVLGLSFKDAALCAVFGNLVGASTVGYMSTWGPRSGNRTLVSLIIFIETGTHIDGFNRSLLGISWAIIQAKSAVCSTSSPTWDTAW